MAVRSRSSGWTYIAAVPWRLLAQRFSFVVFIILACGLIILGRAKPVVVDGARIHAVDSLAPILDAFARPMNAAGNLLTSTRAYFYLRTENEQLRSANAQLKEWQNLVATLQKENNGLRSLTKFKTEPGLAYISARVIADTGGPSCAA